MPSTNGRTAQRRESDAVDQMLSAGTASSGIVSIPSRSTATSKGARSVSPASAASAASDDSFEPQPAERRIAPRNSEVIEISDDDEESDDSYQVRAPKGKGQTKRAVIDDDDEDSSDNDVPVFPVARPAARAPEAAPAFPVPKPYQPPKSGSSNAPSNPAAVPIKQARPPLPPPVRPDGPPRPPAQIGQRPGAPGAKPSVPIRAPPVGALPARAALTPARRADDDDFDVAVDDRLDPRLSAEDAQRELHDLLAGTQEIDVPVDEERAIVEGIAEGIVLKAHQVIARDWMAAREEGKKPGGILADDMGLGKTLQSIVRIVDGRSEDRKQGPTLVVTPASVVTQWVEEIKRMAPGLLVDMYMGPTRTTDPKRLARHHVVVTSYNTVSYEYKAHAGDGKAEGATKSKAAKDTLFRLEWFRIILDEAHTIKNRSTQTAKGCFALKSTKRWCLTGTPMQNGVEELFSLFHFIGVRPYHDWTKYNESVVKPFKAGRVNGPLKRIQVVLKGVMLRRLKNDLVNGKPLIELPGRTVETLFCEFDADERAFYDALANKIEIAVSKFQKAGNLSSNYTAILTLLLRLRQACNHPGLVTRDLKKDKDALESRPADKATADPLKDDASDDLADALAGLTVGAEQRKCTICFAALTAANSAAADTACADCAAQIARQARRRHSDVADDELPPSSAKIRKVLELLETIKARGEGEKTIIFSQFTSWLDILDPFLRAERIRFVRLDGSMKIEERQESLTRIKESKKVNVILVSFKAGSTGLNLTSCNFVILVDLWWNPALEEQAFDRAHRLGQTRDVQIYKLTIADTVEQRILELQEKKRAEARAVLAGDKIKGNKLNMNELMALFKSGGGANDDDDDD